MWLSSTFGFLPAVCLSTQFRQEADNFVTLKPAITPRGNAVCPYSTVVAPASQGVGMNVEEPGHFPDRQHLTQMFIIPRVLSHLLFSWPVLTVAYFS